MQLLLVLTDWKDFLNTEARPPCHLCCHYFPQFTVCLSSCLQCSWQAHVYSWLGPVHPSFPSPRLSLSFLSQCWIPLFISMLDLDSPLLNVTQLISIQAAWSFRILHHPAAQLCLPALNHMQIWSTLFLWLHPSRLSPPFCISLMTLIQLIWKGAKWSLPYHWYSSQLAPGTDVGEEPTPANWTPGQVQDASLDQCFQAPVTLRALAFCT